MQAGLAALCTLTCVLVFFAAPAFAAAPEASSTGVSAITPHEAHLEAIVNTGEEPTECHFLYGKTSATEHEEECEQGNALEGGEQGVSRTVAGLEPATTYHYRIVVKNATSKAESEAEFETLALVKPAISSESVNQITAFAAHLEATLNPDYQPTSCAFEYRKQGAISFEPAVECEQGPILEGGEQGVGVAIGALEPGANYEYRLVAENASGMSTGPAETFVTAGAPQSTTGEATSITQTAVALAGIVSPEGAETTYHFDYISEAGYKAALAAEAANAYTEGEVTATFAVGSNTEPQTAGPIFVSGLLPGTTYYYALVAINEAGENIGAPRTFTTAAPTPPLVSIGAVSALTQTTATLSGTVTTNGLATRYGFEIGTEASGIDTQRCSYEPATGLGSISSPTGEIVTLTLSGLQADTTYDYRIVASNVDGTSCGASQSFTTPGLAYLLTIPATPALITAPASPPIGGKVPQKPTKPLTRTQRRHKALKACRTDKSNAKRLKCERAARKKYLPAKMHEAKN
jgi:hypothetical protein